MCLSRLSSFSCGTLCALQKTYENNLPSKSELTQCKVKDLKSNLKTQQSIFTRPAKQSKAAIIASFKISHILRKENIIKVCEI